MLSRGQLLTKTRGQTTVVTDRTVDVHVKALRAKLSRAGASGTLIQTVRGVGYRLGEDE